MGLTGLTEEAGREKSLLIKAEVATGLATP